MKKTWFAIAALTVVVAALGLFAWLKPPKQTTLYTLSSINGASASTLRLVRKNKPVIALEKRASGWFMTEPHAAPTEEFQLLRMLSVLDAKSTTRFPADQLAKFELDAPQAELVVNGQRFAFGAINTVTSEQYVLTNNAVYPVALTYGAGLPVDAAALFRKSLFAATEIPARFEFANFSIANDNGKWTQTPAGGELSQDDYNRWTDDWKNASSLRTELRDIRKPSGEIVITLKDGNKIALGILQREPELMLARADLGLQFVLAGEVGKRMLAPPAARK